MKTFKTMELYCLYNAPYNVVETSSHLTQASILTKRNQNKERCHEDTELKLHYSLRCT